MVDYNEQEDEYLLVFMCKKMYKSLYIITL